MRPVEESLGRWLAFVLKYSPVSGGDMVRGHLCEFPGVKG
jgi:hypothetical protein